MKSIALQAVVGLFAFVNMLSPAGEPAALPAGACYDDFSHRLKAAIEMRDLGAIQALYQTNGVPAEELNSELNCWRPLLEQDAQTRVNFDQLWFKDLSRAWSQWTAEAHALTTHRATHLVFVPCVIVTRTGEWHMRPMLPLELVQERLLIVPSNSSKAQLDSLYPAALTLKAEANSASKQSQPVHSATNQTPAAAGSGR